MMRIKLENYTSENDNALLQCSNQLGLDWPKIKSCAEGSEGERLLIANSLKTFNLSPEHNYIPWVVIDKGKKLNY